MDISVVIPVYRAESILPKLLNELHKNLSPITSDYEIILVEDGSPDSSWEVLEELSIREKKVVSVKLSRNFGQHYAITAGLELAKGEWIIVMDCDMQDRPDQIPTLYAKIQEGYDLVFARRAVRQDSLLKKLSSKAFYTVFGYLTDTKQDPAIANFGIYRKKVIDAILSMQDHIRYFPTMSQWVGFESTTVDIEHGERDEGKSSYSMKKLFQLAFNNIISFSDKPLILTIRFGFLMVLASSIVSLIYLIKYLKGDIIIVGYTSLILSLWFLSGLMIFFLGMLGIYLAKTFDKVKGRPTYIIDKIINHE